MAKKGLLMVFPVLKDLFEVETGQKNHTFQDLLNHASKLYDELDEDALRLGLYVCQDFPVFTSWGMTQGCLEVMNFSISENIVKMSSLEAQWDELIKSRSQPNPVPHFPSERLVNLGGKFPARFQWQQEFDPGFDWNLLHPAIREVAESRFCSEHFADSVEAALKSVNERVRNSVKRVLGIEMDGSELMQKAFSKNTPVIRLGDLNTITGRNMQLGYMQIFAGAMTGIRNPKAHGNIVIDALRAAHFLFLASLLMYKIDEAEALSSETQAESSEADPSRKPI
jgi:uncharacterized protein (TIGR02391 family)